MTTSALRRVLLASTAVAGTAFAGSIGSAIISSSAEAALCPAAGADTQCGFNVTLNPTGKGTIVATAQGPFDGSDDTLIGVLNSSGHTVTAITVKGTPGNGPSPPNGTGNGTGIDGFDGDGISTFIKGGIPGDGNVAPHYTYSGTDSTTGNANLKGPLNSFSALVFGNGVNDLATVSFPGGLPNGGSAFFSLERALTAAAFTIHTGHIPEPATLSIIGAALAGFGMMRRRRKTAA